MSIHKMLFAFLAMLSSPVFVFGGQSDSCHLDITTSPSTQIGGRFITASGTVNVLFVYVQFPDDNWWTNNGNWPKGQAPTYMNSTVDSVWSSTPTTGGITDFFNQMSFNTLKMTGKSVSVITPHTRVWYLNNNKQADFIHKEVIQQLDATMDFAQFDNWRYNFEYNHTNTADGVVDMIFMMWRNVDSDTLLPDSVTSIRARLDLRPAGYAALGGAYFTVDGGARTIRTGYGTGGSGVTIIHPVGGDLNSGIIWRYARHEFSHWLLGGIEYHTMLGTWGLVDGWGTPSGCINSFEREQLAWMNFNTIDDISTTRTISNVTLPDFITTNTAYRIKVPGGGADEYYLLENHQRISAFDVPDNNVSTAKGLFVLRQAYDQGNGTGIISAEGRFNWSVPARSPSNWGSGYLPVFQRGSSNRVNGYSKRQAIPWYWQSIYQGVAAIHYYINSQGDTVKAPPTIFTGDGKDQFDLNYNTVFSPASNPSSDLYNNSNKIGFEITGFSSSTGIYTFNIHVNTTEDASPAKPMDLSSTTTSDHEPVLSWTASSESDFHHYEVWRYINTQGGPPGTYSLIAPQVTINSYTDYGLVVGGGNWKVYYKIRAVDNTQKVSTYSDVLTLNSSGFFKRGNEEKRNNTIPSDFSLAQNHPNPFNPSTTISYALVEPRHVSLRIYSTLGQEIATLVDEEKEPGYYTVNWNATNMPSGIYFCRIVAGKFSDVKKMLLTK